MKVLRLRFFFIVLSASCFGAYATNENAGEEPVGDSFVSGLKVVYRTYEQCEKVKLGDLVTCLKLRALKFADRILKSNSIPLADGISLVKSYPASEDRNGRKIKFEPLTEINEESLPSNLEERQAKLDELLVERFSRFFRTHSIHFDMPKFAEELKQMVDGSDSNNDVIEGRKKKGKMGGLLLLGGLMKGGMIALGMKGLALLAGKALIVAKIALVLSAIAGLSKLVGGGQGEKTTYEIIKHPHISHAHTHSSSYVDGGHGGGHYDSSGYGHEHYKRSLDIPEAAMYPHLLAFRGQQQQQQQQLNNQQ